MPTGPGSSPTVLATPATAPASPPTATAGRQSQPQASEDDVWDWLERASWLATLIGLPFGAYQVYVLRRDLTRRPRIIVGFGKDLELATFHAEPHFDLSQQAFVAHLVVRNDGPRTARDVRLRLLPEDGLAIPDVGLAQLDAAVDEWQYAVIDVLHPKTQVSRVMTFEPRAHDQWYDLTVGVSYTDSEPEERGLLVGYFSPVHQSEAIKLARVRSRRSG